MSARRKSKTPVGILLVCIVALGGGLWFISSHNKSSVKEDETPTPAVKPEPIPTASAFSPITTTDKKINEGGPSTAYLLAVTYSLLAISDAQYANAVSLVNTDIKKSVDTIIANFKNQIEGIIETPDDQSSLLVHTDVVQSAAAATVVFTISQYASGAAHPLTYVETHAYDLRSGKELALADLFNPGTSYLSTLSTLSRAALLAKLGEENKATITTGTTADTENFQVFKITDKGLVLVFNPYQVASYALGIVEITIPWSDLDSILKPNFRG